MLKKIIEEDLQKIKPESDADYADRTQINRELAERYFAPAKNNGLIRKMSPFKWRLVSIMSSLVFVVSLSLVILLNPTQINYIFRETDLLEEKTHINILSKEQTLNIEIKPVINSYTIINEVSVFTNKRNSKVIMIRIDYENTANTQSRAYLNVCKAEYKNNLTNKFVGYPTTDLNKTINDFKYSNATASGSIAMSYEKEGMSYYLFFPEASAEKAAEFLSEFVK